MKNYIELMRIRLADNVKLTTNFSYSQMGNTLISPLIFISLIENAFKHGVSGDKPSLSISHSQNVPMARLSLFAETAISPNRMMIKVAVASDWSW